MKNLKCKNAELDDNAVNRECVQRKECSIKGVQKYGSVDELIK